MRRGLLRGATGLLLLSLTALSACTINLAPHHNPGPAHPNHLRSSPVERSFGSGAVLFELDLSSSRVTIVQNVHLTLVSRANSGWDVTFPKVGANLGGFKVVAQNGGRPRLTRRNRVLREHSYTLEPFLPGHYRIPPLVLTATKGKQTRRITTKPLSVSVVGLIQKSAKRPLTLRPPEGPVDVPSPVPVIIGGGFALFSVLAASVLFLIGRLRRKQRERQKRVPPWVRASRELDQLLRTDLLHKGRQHEFYDRLMLLVRRYVEETFEIEEPEQTTEEFLYAARESPALGQYRHYLREFLSHCDLVKFAAYLPAEEEVAKAVRSFRELIASTSGDADEHQGGGVTPW